MSKKNKWNKFVFWILFLVSVLFLISPAGRLVKITKVVFSYIFVPSVKSGYYLASYVGSIPEKTLHLLNAEDENRYLRKLAEQNKIIKTQIESLLKENKRLSSLLDLNPTIRWQGVWAGIMARETVNWNSVIFINKGANDAIKISDTVLGAINNNELGLVGKVIWTNKSSSKVMLLTDIMSAVHCYLYPTLYESLLEGAGGNTLKIKYIPISAEINLGDSVFTSPSSSIFPANILVGTIDKIPPKQKYMLYFSANVKPAVEIFALKKVFVITGNKK